MSNRRKLLISELKKKFPLNFIIGFTLFVIVMLIPLICIYKKVFFDYVQFANIYISSVFTSILIAFTLQMLEMYKTFQVSTNSLSASLLSISSVLKKITNYENEEDFQIKAICDLLIYYRSNLVKCNVNNIQLNEEIILLYSCSELEYVIRSIKEGEFTESKKKEMTAKVEKIEIQINKVHDFLK